MGGKNGRIMVGKGGGLCWVEVCVGKGRGLRVVKGVELRVGKEGVLWV